MSLIEKAAQIEPNSLYIGQKKGLHLRSKKSFPEEFVQIDLSEILYATSVTRTKEGKISIIANILPRSKVLFKERLRKMYNHESNILEEESRINKPPRYKEYDFRENPFAEGIKEELERYRQWLENDQRLLEWERKARTARVLRSEKYEGFVRHLEKQLFKDLERLPTYHISFNDRANITISGKRRVYPLSDLPNEAECHTNDRFGRKINVVFYQIR